MAPAEVQQRRVEIGDRTFLMVQILLDEIPKRSVLARRMHVTENTVKKLMDRLYHRLGVHSRAELFSCLMSGEVQLVSRSGNTLF